MSYQIRMLAALRAAQVLCAAGRGVGHCLDQAVTAQAVSREELACRWLELLVERDRARAALASMAEADDAQ